MWRKNGIRGGAMPGGRIVTGKASQARKTSDEDAQKAGSAL
jgi:hypothetical protein